ncbi:hypothetical protein HZA39_02650 [Candidatus Peregrinibacteria bacterium]|nr:hypothetical protein [Candidatus Peregrinibacteria bacterium]
MGKVIHYYDKINVGIVELKGILKVGDTVRIKGNHTDLTQAVDSMQIEHKQVEKAKAKDVIGMKVGEPVREGDMVYKA